MTAVSKVRRAFDITTQAQEAALASLDADEEVARRRAANRTGRAELEGILRAHGFELAAPAVANFLFADAGDDAQALFDALLREGVIVRPLSGFGAPEAIRITVGTSDEHAFLDEALARVKTGLPAS